MLFQKRIDRAMDYAKEQGKKRKSSLETEYDPKTEWEELSLGENLEKGDGLALVISALLVFLPICLLILGIICLGGMLPFLF